MVTVPLPHLAGLAAAVRVDLDDRVPTMGRPAAWLFLLTMTASAGLILLTTSSANSITITAPAGILDDAKLL